MAAKREKLEWLCGVVRMPDSVVVVWVELPSREMVRLDILDGDGAPDFATLFAGAMSAPARGKPRAPARLRTADGEAAEAIAPVADARGVQVVVAPTPELDSLVERLSEVSLADAAPDGYLDGSTAVSTTCMGRLFDAAADLYALAPWEDANDNDLVRIDVPALGVAGACACVVGAATGAPGILLFPSDAARVAFGRSAEQGGADFGTDWLALSFAAGEDLPQEMLDEVREFGWRVAGPAAFPLPEHADRRGAPVPPTEHEVDLLAATARAIVALVEQHGTDVFDGSRGLVSAVAEGARAAVPYAAVRREAAPARVGRNDPCPCGSGKKYKKCHMQADATSKPARSSLHTVDERLVRDLTRFALRRFGAEWQAQLDELLGDELMVPLAIPWALYHLPVQARSIVAHYLAERGGSLPPRDRAWLEAQRDAWPSICEIVATAPGKSITVRDLLTGQQQVVGEATASHHARPDDVLLCRVVSYDGERVFAGVHSQPLPSLQGLDVADAVKKRLRRKRDISPERARNATVGRWLMESWSDAVADLVGRRDVMPELENTDGDPLLLTVDHFAFPTGERAVIASALANLPGAEPDGDGGFAFLTPGNALQKSWEKTVVGQVRLGARSLRIETNSVRRADDLRARVENALGDRITHRAREHSDPVAPPVRNAPRAGGPVGLQRPELVQAVRDFKANHYATWVDTPIPALDDATPRDAVRTKSGRKRVELLLTEMESMEARVPEAERYDFDELRRALGIA